MKKKRTKILGIIIIMLAGLGWWGYDSFFRSDPVVQQQLADQFGPQFFDLDTSSASAGNKTTQPAAGSFTAAYLEHAEQKQYISSELAPENGTPELLSAEVIIQKYAPEFQVLEQAANSGMETIYSAAVAEYQQQAKAGTLDHSAWTRKYLQACLLLQANVDGRFNSTLKYMEAELATNHQSTQISSEIKNHYSAAKRQKVAELVARAHGK